MGLLLFAGGSNAQEPDSVRAELTRLRATVDSLAREVSRLQATGAQPAEADDPIARLRAAAQAAAAQGGGAVGGAAQPAGQPDQQEFIGRQRSLQALNPEISLTADMFGHVNQDDTDAENFFAREFEIAVQSNLDPFSRAKVFISRHSPGGDLTPFGAGEEEEAEFSVEEGYVQWVSLPGGFNVKLGKFFQQFGQLNRWHGHALPFQTRSLPHLSYVGEEQLAQTGLSIHWLLPIGGSLGTYESTVEVTRSENENLFGESGRPSVLGHLNGFWNLSTSTDVELGVSWVNGSYEDATDFFDRNLYGLEGAFTWRPPGRSTYRGLTVRGGVMVLDGLLLDSGAAPADRAMGVWGLGELRLSTSWLAGARFDRAENPADPEQTAWLASPTLTWWQSEFVRVRAEYDLLGRSFVTDREGRFLIQVTFAMGPHKHETY